MSKGAAVSNATCPETRPDILFLGVADTTPVLVT